MDYQTITAEIIQGYISKNSIKFQSTHYKLSLPIINRIYKKMMHGIKFDDIKTCENLIIDGHHRYISALLANFDIRNTNTNKTSATTIYQWTEVNFIDEEWDTEVKIQHLNNLDAVFNNISVEKILELTK